MAVGFASKESVVRTWSATHAKARKMVPQGPCEKCGRESARDVHHVDGNHMNNERSNLQRICRGCHNQAHRPAKCCVICGRPQKGLGYCELHYQRFKKWGDPLIVKDNGFVLARRDSDANPQKSCAVLGCLRKYHGKGYCGMHLQRVNRGRLLSGD